jgi:hypothetical protein
MAIVNVVTIDDAYVGQVLELIATTGSNVRVASVANVNTYPTWSTVLSNGRETLGSTPIISSGDTLYFAATGRVDSALGLDMNVNAVSRISMSNAGVGFNGGGELNRPTVSGSRGGNAALGSLLGILDTMGLITDGTTA